MFNSESLKAQVIISCTRTIICNYGDKNPVPDDILYDGGNVDEQ